MHSCCVVLCNILMLLWDFIYFLNQVRAWFLKIDPVRIVSMCACVCVSVPEAINN